MLPLKELYLAYRKWVVKNPELTSDMENIFKWSSYFIAGRFNQTAFGTEAVYAVSKLLVLFNDRLIKTATPQDVSDADKLRVWLTALEYSEVFIELSAFKLWGARGKWILITAIQVIKCCTRLILLLKYQKRMVSSPAMPPLVRNEPSTSTAASAEAPSVRSVAFTLKRSGKVVRKVEAAPARRLWTPPDRSDVSDSDELEEERRELRRYIAGEIVYIVRPIAHLLARYRYGEQSWRPFLFSLSLDLASLALCHRRKTKSDAERLELSNRSLQLFLYLLRSPFYERHSKDRIASFLDAFSRTIPLARFACGPLKEYIPFWQSTYSYNWST